MNFDFIAVLEKAEVLDGRYFVSGVASTTDKDIQNDVITANALQEMAKSAIGVPIVTSHNHEMHDEIGSIVEAHYDNQRLFIKAELDAEDPLAIRTYKKIEKAKRVGFSIGANVKRLTKHVDKSVRMAVDAVEWKHVMITSKPVNQNTFCIALNKALDEDPTMENEAPKNPAKDVPVPDSGDGQISIGGDEPTKIGPSLQERTSNEPQFNDMGGTMLKAGAKYSADTVAQLKSIHDGGNDDTKTKVRSMLGDDAASILDAPANAGGSGFVGVLDKAALDEFKVDIVKSFQLELAKSQSALTTVIQKAEEPEPHPGDIRAILAKAVKG